MFVNLLLFKNFDVKQRQFMPESFATFFFCKKKRSSSFQVNFVSLINTPSFMTRVTPSTFWITTGSAAFTNVPVLSGFTTSADLITFTKVYSFNLLNKLKNVITKIVERKWMFSTRCTVGESVFNNYLRNK